MDNQKYSLFSVPSLVAIEIISQIQDVRTLVRLAATNSYIRDLICCTRRKNPIVIKEKCLVITARDGIALGAVTSEINSSTLNFSDLTPYLTFLRFLCVRLRTTAIQNEEVCYMLKPLHGYCKELVIDIDDGRGNENIAKLIEALDPPMTKLIIDNHVIYSPELIYSFDSCKAIDITVSDIQRITNDLRYFIYPHEVVILRVRLFSVNMLGRMFRRWDQNRHSFGHLQRLEFHITDPTFIYAPRYLLRRRNSRFLGAPLASNGGAVVLGIERKALIIFDTYRIVFVPLTFPNQEVCVLVEEFGRRTPIDISGVLSTNHPFCKILELQQSSHWDDWE